MAKITITNNEGIIYGIIDVNAEDLSHPSLVMDDLIHDLTLAIKDD